MQGGAYDPRRGQPHEVPAMNKYEWRQKEHARRLARHMRKVEKDRKDPGTHPNQPIRILRLAHPEGRESHPSLWWARNETPGELELVRLSGDDIEKAKPGMAVRSPFAWNDINAQLVEGI